MKMIKSFSFAFMTAILMSTASFAATDSTTPSSEKKQLRSEVLQYLQKADLADLNTKARIKFMVTSQDEIVVLDVNTDQNYVERILKSNLNYKKVKTQLSKKNQIYFIDVTFNIE